jgi:hypothetical protein
MDNASENKNKKSKVFLFFAQKINIKAKTLVKSIKNLVMSDIASV